MSMWADESPEARRRMDALRVRHKGTMAWAARNGYRVPRPPRRRGRMSAPTPAGGARLRVW